MLRRLQTFFVLGVWVVAIPAAAQEATDDPAPKDQKSAQAGTGPAAPEEPTAKPTSEEPTVKPTSEEPTAKPTSEEPTAKPTSKDQKSAQAGTGPAAPPPTTEVKPVEQPEGWHTFITGYFRAPMALGISSRPAPDQMGRTNPDGTPIPDGPSQLQVSYGPTRTVDASYYSFAYTRLQEQDWAELFVHAKRKHVEAVLGMMGYWYQSAGFRVPDASWFPGMAYVTLDTDLAVAPNLKPNIALTVGAFWPAFGTFAKYDTYTLGRFRQLGEQVKLTVPVNPDLTVTLVQGFGTGRDGSYNYGVGGAPPIYGAKVGLDLITYANVQLTYKKYVDIGLHYNHEWTADPNLFQQATAGKAYTDVSQAHLSVVGAEASLRAPFAGRLWISPSYITVRNGWALGANGGTEVMHSLGGAGIAGNYMAWTNSPPDSTGSGSTFNLGLLYENSLSGILDKPPGRVMPDLTLNVFGLMANANLDLPAGSVIAQNLTQNKIKQFKYGADLTLQALDWLGLMLRYDTVNYDLDHPGYIFSAITSRVIFSTHFLSSESIYVQYSRYRYGDKIVLNGPWPWGSPLVAGSDIIQSGSYSGQKPDMDVIKLQATVAF
jgi:hypothetical protein